MYFFVISKRTRTLRMPSPVCSIRRDSPPCRTWSFSRTRTSLILRESYRLRLSRQQRRTSWSSARDSSTTSQGHSSSPHQQDSERPAFVDRMRSEMPTALLQKTQGHFPSTLPYTRSRRQHCVRSTTRSSRRSQCGSSWNCPLAKEALTEFGCTSTDQTKSH